MKEENKKKEEMKMIMIMIMKIPVQKNRKLMNLTTTATIKRAKNWKIFLEKQKQNHIFIICL